jgi:surface antigen
MAEGTGTGTDETVEYCAALDGGLLTLQGTVGLRDNTRKILFTLDTAATSIYMATNKAKSF